jgi:lipopolysaccharide transport protein LptA
MIRSPNKRDYNKRTNLQTYSMSRIRLVENIRRAVSCILAFYLLFHAGIAGSIDFSSDDTVTVTATKAWEAEEADVIHFSGGVELRAPDWSLEGETATVYGKLDNPDKVIVEGNPAKISFLRADEEAGSSNDSEEPEERVDGAASIVEYFRATDKLKMRGSASLTRKDSTLVSEVIEYDVDTDRYSAGGEGGINIQFNPDDD